MKERAADLQGRQRSATTLGHMERRRRLRQSGSVRVVMERRKNLPG